MNPLRIGVIGASGRGDMARHWHEPGGRSVVAGAADISDAALESFRRKINREAFVTLDPFELIARPELDAIAVMSPDDTHERYVCAAFEAGKHVFTEKPMANTTEGCDRMLRAWIASGRQFMVGFNMRYMNLFRVMKDAIDAGMIGEVKAVWVRHFVGLGGGFYYHDWQSSSRHTTGLLLQKASHDLDMIHWLTGRYAVRVAACGGLDYYGGDKPDDLHCPDCPERGECVEYQHRAAAPANKRDLCAFRRSVDVEDHSIMMMELEGGLRASYMQCMYAPDYCRNYTVIGTEGRLENLDDSTKVIVRMRDRSKRWKNLADASLAVKSAEGGHAGADPRVCRDFVDMLREGKRPLSTPLAGRMSVAAGCAATESLRNGWTPLRVPPLPEDLQGRVY